MSEWLLLASICFMGAMVPGANTAIVLRSTLSGDKRGAFITVAGLCCALALHVLFSMVGLTALIGETPALYEPIRWLGSAYLLYMGITYLLTRGSNEDQSDLAANNLQHPFLTGLMVSLFNPKLLLMFMALFSQILDAAHSWPEKLLYGVTPLVAEASWLSLIILVLSRPEVQAKMLHIKRGMERLIGTGLVLLGIKIGLG